MYITKYCLSIDIYMLYCYMLCIYICTYIGVKKNPSSALYTNLGVMTKGTVIEVNVSELGLVTQSGKVVWGKYAQVTNNPELDGCINALLLV